MVGVAEGPDAVFLHIGAMKTGTSYIQQLLLENESALSAEGMLFPSDPGWGVQVRGVRDILRLGADPYKEAAAVGAWRELRQQIFKHDGRAAVISMEFLSFAHETRAKALIESLAPADVHVVVTIRDAGRVLPAQWQESTQNRGLASWQEYTDAVLSEGSARQSPAWRASMRALNVPRMLAAWAPLVPSRRLHLVMVPPPGSPSTLLWERFAAALGLDPSRFEPPREHSNPSLGYVSADLMRRANEHLRKLPPMTYQTTVKYFLCKQVLAGRTGEPRVAMTEALNDFATDWNAKTVSAITATGGRVYGDLSDLDLLPGPTVEVIEELPRVDLLTAAADAMVGLRQLIDLRMRRLEKVKTDLASGRRNDDRDDEPETYAAPRRPKRRAYTRSWRDHPDPVAAAAADVAAAIKEAVDVRLQRRRLAGFDDSVAMKPGPALTVAWRRAKRLRRRTINRLSR